MEKLIVVLENIAYIFAISFQLSAAWMLVGNTSVTREGIIKAYCANHKGGIPFDRKGKLLDRRSLEVTVIIAWTNRIAFTFLGIGYLLSIFGTYTIRKEVVLIIVVVLTAILVVLPSTYAKKKSQEFESPCLDDIPLVDGVQIEIVGDEEYHKDELLK